MIIAAADAATNATTFDDANVAELGLAHTSLIERDVL